MPEQVGSVHRRRASELRKYEKFAAACPVIMRRPKYRNRVGIRHGSKGATIWVKVYLPCGGAWQSKSFHPGAAVEIKLGWASSVSWEEAIATRDELQRRADRGEPLEHRQPQTVATWAADWLTRKTGVISGWKREKTHLRVHILPRLGCKPIDRITAIDIEHWIAEKRAAGLRPGYIKRLMNTLKSVTE